MTVRTERIAIIGAGPCGIAAGKNFLDEGFHNITIYEQKDVIGGNWVFSKEPNRHASVYETTHLVSSASLSQYLDYPFPDETPDFPGHAAMRNYFQDYARRFGVDHFIEFQTRVERVQPRDDGKWLVTVNKNGVRHSSVFDCLVVANGHHWAPKFPEYPGKFTGIYVHSHDYTDAAPFKDKRVLVIGGGNSGCDIAVETSRISKTSEISIRHGGWYIPKLLFGLPTDVFYGKLQWMTTGLQKFFMELAIRLHVGSWSRYGMPAPRGRVYDGISVHNTELLYFIRHGKIRIRGAIKKFEGKHVHFADGSVAEYDVIVAATGFKIKFPFLDTALINPRALNFDLYLHMIHPGYRNLFFVGLCQPSGCVWSVAELQAKVIARHLAGKLKLEVPAKLRGGFSLYLDYPSYRKRLVGLLGKHFVSREMSPIAKRAQQNRYELVEKSA